MDALAGMVGSLLFVVLLTVIPCILLFWLACGLRTSFERDKTEDEPQPGLGNARLRSGKETRQQRVEALRKAHERKEKAKQYAREVEYAAGVRRLRLEVEDRRKRLSQVQGGPPKKILVAELELAEKESEVEYYQGWSDMSEEKRLEFRSRLAALREQIKKEKKARWNIFGT